jgi:hypothetical protein
MRKGISVISSVFLVFAIAACSAGQNIDPVDRYDRIGMQVLVEEALKK